MFEDEPQITFGALKTELKAIIWPNGVPENLVAAIDKSFEDAFIDIQVFVSCLQKNHTDVFAQCATYFKCGLTVFDKPRGNISRVQTIQTIGTENFCDPVTLEPATMEEIYCWSRKFMDRVTAPANVGMPALPMGFRFADATTDSQWGRALLGKFSWDRSNRMYVAPWIQSYESVIVQWDGLKKKFSDADLMPDDQQFKRTMRLYVQGEFSRDFERDWVGQKGFKQDYTDARADMIYDCDKEIRLPQATSCAAERQVLYRHQWMETVPDTAEVPTIAALFGNYGVNNADEAAVAALVKSWSPMGVLTLGNNTYGLPYDTAVGAFYRMFMFPYPGTQPLGAGEVAATANMFWPCLGAQDNDDLAAYLAYFSGITPSNDRFYDVVIGPIHFFVLNDGINSADDPTIEPAGNDALSTQASWFRARVAQSTSPFKIAIIAHPPYASPYAFAQSDVLQWVNGVNLVISGQNSHYERLAKDGQTYLIAGSGGNALDVYGPTVAPESQLRYDEEHGAIKITATCAEMTVEFINVSGVVIDTLTINA